MNRLIIFVILLFLSSVVSYGLLSPRLLKHSIRKEIISEAVYDLQYSRVDGSWWECNTLNPYYSHQIGSGGRLGNNTNTWNGHSYWIDTRSDVLMRNDYVIGPLVWFDNRIWDVQYIHGFAISSNGIGWIASSDSDYNDVSFLLSVDLNTAQIEVVGFLSEDSNNPHVSPMVNGMIVKEYSITNIINVFVTIEISTNLVNWMPYTNFYLFSMTNCDIDSMFFKPTLTITSQSNN